MPRYEYKVVPAPTKGLKAKGVRGAEGRFSHALEDLMNTMAGAGWEFQRAETLPQVERAGLTGSSTEWRNVLVFRRPHLGDATDFRPELLPAPKADDQSAVTQESALTDDADAEPPQDGAAAGSPTGLLARVRNRGRVLAAGRTSSVAELPADNPENPSDPKA